jgi:large subunit ribosomal protein L4
MPEVQVRNQSGDIVGTIPLNDDAFGGEGKEHLIHDVVVMQLANRRRGTASTKTRAAISYSTAKPWRQKGTGRARAGSRRSPIWRGGGITFGPAPRDYSYKLPRKVRKQALRAAVAEKVKNNEVIVIDSLEMSEPKTKLFNELMRNLGIDGSTLVLLDGENRNLRLSVRNIPGVKTLQIKGLNVYDLVYHQQIIVSRDIIPGLEEVLS